MTGSTTSSDPLSSPSPSPTPPPQPAPGPSSVGAAPHARSSASTSKAANDTRRPPNSGATGLDSGSELSELTEDEQENGSGNTHDSKKRASTRDEDEDEDEDEDDTPDTDKRPPPPSRRPTKTRRRKRSSIVPAPMWGWASKEQRALEAMEEEEASRQEEEEEEEEEEEDVPQPPRAMEEEEGDDDEDDEDATARPSRVANVKRNQAIRARMRVAQYRDDGDDEDEGDDPSYKQTKKPRANGHAYDETSEDDEDDDDDDVEAPSKSTRDPPGPSSTSQDGKKLGPSDKGSPETSRAAEEEASAPPLSPIAPAQAPVPSPTRSTKPPSRGRLDAPNGPAAASTTSATSSREHSPSRSDEEEEDEEQRMSLADVSRQRRESLLLEAAGVTEPTESTYTATKDQDGDVDMAQDPDGGDEVNDDDNRSTGEIDPDGDVDVEGEGDHEEDAELESDMQPAHRAEALDELAILEYKWAKLREMIYVEKMDDLAWEEDLVRDGTHPEMLHLLGELTNRRDKRIELASRKRLYEIASIGKRRRAEESATWSWWQFNRDQLQTDMVAETNRKRRKLERERRVSERPPAPRRIPIKPTSVPAAPSLHQIVKTLPFSSGYAKQRPEEYSPQASMYPDLNVLSVSDITSDLEYIYQGRRHSNYDNREHRNAPTNASAPGPSTHPSNYDQPQYVDSYGRPAPPPPQGAGPAYSHHPMNNGPMPGGNYPYMPGPPPASAGRMHQHHQPGPSNAGGSSIPSHHVHPSQQQHLNHERERMERDRERAEREHELAGPAMGGGSGHQMHPNHPYFGQGRSGAANIYSAGAGHPQEQPSMGGRRSPSPGMPANGDPNMKHGSGTWLGPGMGMGAYLPNSKAGPEWAERERRIQHAIDTPVSEKEEREKWMREREEQRNLEREREWFNQEREREKQRELRNREKEREKRKETEAREMDRDRVERERERDREKEHMEMEHERHREREHYLQHERFNQQQQAQQQHRPPTGPHSHSHSVPHGPHHHHHRGPHHHHIVHHHHSQSGSSSHPPQSGHSASSAPPGVPGHSPRVSRDYEGRHPADAGPSMAPKPLWKGDVRDREKVREKERDGDVRGPSSSAAHIVDDRDRPVPVPLSLGPAGSSLPPTSSGAPQHVNGTSSPRTQWNPADDGYRPSSSSSGPPGYGSAPEQQTRSPSNRYANPSGGNIGRGQAPPSGPSPLQNSMAASPPRRPPPPPSPGSSSNYNNSNAATQHSPPRYGPPLPPSMQSGSSSRTSPVALKIRPSSPGAGPSGKAGGAVGPSSYGSSPRLAGPGRTSTPTGGPAPSSQANSNGPPRPYGPPPPPTSSSAAARRSPSPAGGRQGGLLPPMGPAPPPGMMGGIEREMEWERATGGQWTIV